MPTWSAPVPRPRAVRVLGLAHDSSALPDVLPVPASLVDVTLTVGCAQPPPGGMTYPVHHLVRRSPVAPAERVRTLGSRIKTQWLASTAGAPVEWLWTMKGNRWLRRQLAGVDLVLSLDEHTDQALLMAPELARGVPVLRSHDSARVWSGLTDGERLLSHLRQVAMTEEPVEVGQLPHWGDMASGLCLPATPPCLAPVEAVAAVGRDLSSRLSPDLAALIISTVLDLPPWPPERRGYSGLAAQRAAADLWLARTDGDRPGEDELSEAVAAALEGGAAALGAGDTELALALHVDALALLFHRERHAEVDRSALVDDPEAFLDSLWASPVHRRLVSPAARPGRTMVSSRARASGRPRVLIVPGAYGDFHQPVVHALKADANVRALNIVSPGNRTWKRLSDGEVLSSLAHLRFTCDRSDLPGLARLSSLEAERADRLREGLEWPDVIFSDWADRATVWVSHAKPPSARLVVRIHGLDALDPWFQLVDWAAVDHIVVTAEFMRRLVEDLLSVAGASVPVTLLPNLVPLPRFAMPKPESARTTLGMVGWGRKVKDPLWALELLAREPSWRLRLIGSDFPEVLSHSGTHYAETFRRRLRDPVIRDRVEVVGWTDDVPQELTKVGVILSTSRRENWHQGLVEGAASGAVPVVRDWPLWSSRGGPSALFPSDWVVHDLDEAETRVREVTAPDRWLDQGAQAREQAGALFDPDHAAATYREIVLGVSRDSR